MGGATVWVMIDNTHVVVLRVVSSDRVRVCRASSDLFRVDSTSDFQGRDAFPAQRKGTNATLIDSLGKRHKRHTEAH